MLCLRLDRQVCILRLSSLRQSILVKFVSCVYQVEDRAYYSDLYLASIKSKTEHTSQVCILRLSSLRQSILVKFVSCLYQV